MKIKHSELRELIQETLSERDKTAEAALLSSAFAKIITVLSSE